jgi:hypothetical protein
MATPFDGSSPVETRQSGVDAHAGCGIYNSGQGRAFIVDDKGLPAQVGSAGGFDPQGEVWDQ